MHAPDSRGLRAAVAERSNCSLPRVTDHGQLRRRCPSSNVLGRLVKLLNLREANLSHKFRHMPTKLSYISQTCLGSEDRGFRCSSSLTGSARSTEDRHHASAGGIGVLFPWHSRVFVDRETHYIQEYPVNLVGFTGGLGAPVSYSPGSWAKLKPLSKPIRDWQNTKLSIVTGGGAGAIRGGEVTWFTFPNGQKQQLDGTHSFELGPYLTAGSAVTGTLGPRI